MNFLKFYSHQLLSTNPARRAEGAGQEKRFCCRNWIRSKLQLSSSFCWRADLVLPVAKLVSCSTQFLLLMILLLNISRSCSSYTSTSTALSHSHRHQHSHHHHHQKDAGQNNNNNKSNRKRKRNNKDGKGGKHFVDLLTFCDVIKVDCHRLLHVLA